MRLEKLSLSNGSVMYGIDTTEDREILESKGVDVDKLELEEGLNFSKVLQKTIIKDSKKERQSRPVEVRSVLFNGGREAGQKYDEAFRLAKMKGLTEGDFADAEGNMVLVNEAYATEIVVSVAGASYNLWAQEHGYLQQIDAATTVEEVEAIVWVDA